MARIRTVKPEFFLHEGLYDLEQETGWPMRIAYEGLWCQADREGRFAWQPRKLKAQVCPYDECDFSRVLDALASRGFLVKYACRGQLFGAIPTFKSHQVINNKERASVLPEFTSTDCEIVTCTDEARELHALTTRDSKEGKGREGNKIPPKSPKGDREKFKAPTIDQVRSYCLERKNSVDAELFIDHYEARGWKYKGGQPMKDWRAAVRTWEKSNFNGQPVQQRAMTSEELREWKP